MDDLLAHVEKKCTKQNNLQLKFNTMDSQTQCRELQGGKTPQRREQRPATIHNISQPKIHVTVCMGGCIDVREWERESAWER